jgi:hypothetical protein
MDSGDLQGLLQSGFPAEPSPAGDSVSGDANVSAAPGARDAPREIFPQVSKELEGSEQKPRHLLYCSTTVSYRLRGLESVRFFQPCVDKEHATAKRSIEV